MTTAIKSKETRQKSCTCQQWPIHVIAGTIECWNNRMLDHSWNNRMLVKSTRFYPYFGRKR